MSIFMNMVFGCRSRVFYLCSQQDKYNFSDQCYGKFQEMIHDYLVNTAAIKLKAASETTDAQFVAEVGASPPWPWSLIVVVG